MLALAEMPLARKAAAEAIGMALLLSTVVGSGIMAERLSGGSNAIALLANAIATGGGLVALILALGPISGAHLNPAVTLVSAIQGEFGWREIPAYVGAQVAGALLGVALAHAMFGLPAFSVSTHVRSGVAQVLAEGVATFGLILVIWGCSRGHRAALSFAVASYITAAYWFTSSTSFANPAVTIARSLTNTFSGIRPQDVPGFLVGEALGTTAAVLFIRWLMAPRKSLRAARRSASSGPELPNG